MPKEEYFDASKVVVRQIEKSLAEDMIVKYHYSHKWSLCQVAYGVFYITNKQSDFFDAIVEKLIGCIVFSQPAGRSAAASISDLIKVDECMELIRLVILDGYGRNIESFSISQSLKLLKRDFSHVRAIISYSDTEQNHIGTIYQATNFLFTGLNSDTNLMPNFSVSLIGPPNYKWMHSRSVSSRWGSHNVEYLKKKIGKTFWRKKEAGRLRYIYIISDKKTKKEIMKTLKMKILPYPKNCSYNENIEKIVVDDFITKNQFFG
jgi:hypothetical protein